MAALSTEPIEAVIFDIGGVLFENIQEFFLPDLARRYGRDPAWPAARDGDSHNG